MITRRNVLAGSAVTAACIALGRTDSLFAASMQTPVNFAVPAGAFDCHTHAIGDPKRFPFAPGQGYFVGTATAQESIALHKTLHIDRTVIINISNYGTDMSCTFDAMRRMGSGARAIALIDDKTTSAQLDRMDRAGVRGIRINLLVLGRSGAPIDAATVGQQIRTAVKQFGGRKWHIQILAQMPAFDSIYDAINESRVPIVIDHFGAARAALGLDQPGFRSLLKLVHAGKAYVKLSATYHVSDRPNDYTDVAPIAKALIEANPERMLWGTNWFHPIPVNLPGRTGVGEGPNLKIDNGRLLNVLAEWAPDPAIRKLILVDNPARLFDT